MQPALEPFPQATKDPTAMTKIALRVNRVAHEIEADPATPLIFVLRNQLGLTGAKLGCGLEQCGACAVLVDGVEVLSCVRAVSEFEGHDSERYYTRSLISAPIVYRGRLYGVINVNNKRSREPYDENDLELLLHIAAHAAVAVANAQSYEELLDRAQHDSLTGLANHGYFWSVVAREWGRADRYGREVSVVMMDLDYFKRSNDVHGHLTGDETLRQMAQILQDSARAADLPARYGGDEFAVILPETSEDGALAFGEKIRQRVEADRVGPEGNPVSISVGVATYPGDGESAADLVRAADRELYRAKQAGRNRVCSKNPG